MSAATTTPESTRAIAPTVGVSHPTVIADQRAGGKSLTTSPEPESLDEYRGRALADAASASIR